MSYTDDINKLADRVPEIIVDFKSVQKKGKAPTQAFSDFLTHKAQGDWAEGLIFNAIKEMDSDYVPIKYGKSDELTAGDPEFKSFYDSYQKELSLIGKRPDILLYTRKSHDNSFGEDISTLSQGDLDRIVPNAFAGFEVRSSAYLTRKFATSDSRANLSFTPKSEDLVVVKKWINTYKVPHFYVQVFFDNIYIIPFKKILHLLSSVTINSSNKKITGKIDDRLVFDVERNPKNQFKSTLHFLLNNGTEIGSITEPPKIIAKQKELNNGRLLHYVSFEGGKAVLDAKNFHDSILYS